MKKVLLIGNLNSIWIKRYVEYVLLDGDHRVYLYHAPYAPNTEFLDFYAQNPITIIHEPRAPRSIFMRISKLKALIYYVSHIFSFRRHGRYDVIHVQCLCEAYMRFVPYIKSAKTVVVITYLGSELLRGKDAVLQKLKSSLDMATYVTLATDVMKKKFTEVYGSAYDSKVRTALFGVSGFQDIDSVRSAKTQADCKTELGLDPAKLTVAVGYNAMEAQRHDKVLLEIEKLPAERQNTMELVLQFGYGKMSKEYENAIAGICARLLCKVVIIREFMDDERVAVLRNAVDVFIVAQPTDGFSASMQEYIYAGAVALIPDWLVYSEMDEYGIRYMRYGDFAQLPGILADICENPPVKLACNRVIARHTSWAAVKPAWLECYNRLTR